MSKTTQNTENEAQRKARELREAKAAEKAAAAAAVLAAKPGRAVRERKASLVLPSYSLKQFETGDSFAVRVDSEIISKADIDQKTGEQKLNKQGEPAELHLVNVTDLDTGEVGQMVLPFIIHQALEKITPLAGHEFEFVKGKAESNKATMWEVYEI